MDEKLKNDIQNLNKYFKEYAKDVLQEILDGSEAKDIEVYYAVELFRKYFNRACDKFLKEGEI